MNASILAKLSLIAVVTNLAGCAAVDSINTLIEEQRQKEEAARFVAARTACEKYGFRTGTDTYAQCLQTEINQIKNREAIAAAARNAADATEEASKKSVTCKKDTFGQLKCTPD